MATLFSVPELLEGILLHLDMTTLLVSANRVCKAWHDVISTSPHLRRALYFDPEHISSRPRQEAQAEKDSNSAVLNPLLVKFFSPCFFDSTNEAYRRRANSFYSMPWVSKPREESLTERGQMMAVPQYPRIGPSGPGDTADRVRFTRKGASWRRMLVSQPPPRQLGYLRMDEDFLNDHLNYWDSLIDPDDDDGLRMGQLYDVVQYSASHHLRHSLWFRVHWSQSRGPWYCYFDEQAMQRLVEQTGVLVELCEMDDEGAYHYRDPVDPSRFDEIFRCDEARPSKVEENLAATIEILPVGFGFGADAFVW